MTYTRFRKAFSLIELVIVVVIIGIIGAIAIPRMSRGASGAQDSAVTANLAVLRNAISLFEAEHPGTYPAVATFVAQMTTYTDMTGAASATKDSTHVYGPYLRSVPTLPVGANKGSATVAAAQAASVGWVYDATTGVIIAGTTSGEVDAAGVKYNTY
ncbi:prepilin-type N-terminal cleavage/methylation domain-containing protein [bacterium]|nr:MAG: prepilin-type N-terminal cleavage/methylation domain-containing protein [bacterium]